MTALPAIPISTYRVQFGPRFRFVDGERIVPYLAALGIGHLYASPYFQARPGSEHGYDVVDHNRLNPEIGDEREHRAMIAAAQRAGIGHLLDFVPNHMGIGSDNPWWRDVLTYGPLSPYARFFDIDWHPQSTGRGKLVLPFLGDHYGAIVERGELTVGFAGSDGSLAIRYFEHVFPLAPATYAAVLLFAAESAAAETAADLRALAASFAALRGRPRELRRRAALRARAEALQRELQERCTGDPATARALERGCAEFSADPDRIDALAAAQHYRLVYWRVAADEINYRRFFDINDLAGLRIEDAEVLARTHELVFAMIADGRVQGLRIDHVDGLANPGGYCNFLVDLAAALEQPLYVLVEKILGAGERLRPSWRIAGTTGYDFLNLVAGLFVDAAAERGFDRIYRRVIGRTTAFADEAYEAKRRVMRIDLASELQVLTDALVRIARKDRRSSDFTGLLLRRVLTEVIAAFHVYRTYVVDDVTEVDDREIIERAVARASDRRELADPSVFAFVAAVLRADPALFADAHYDRTEVIAFAMRFQQYTGPVAAKSIEDTAFYRYVRLVALNDVGGDPERFGRSVDEFHAANAERATTRPHAMLATATHDHKRGEDTRLRIAALSEFPAEWSRSVARWDRMNAGNRDAASGAPSANAEYLFYQTVVGTLPLEFLGGNGVPVDALDPYVERLVAYAIKAAREAKVLTSWTDPVAAYERGLAAFVRAALAAETPFLRDVRAFVTTLAPLAAVGSLAQTTLKLTAPGVPDIYQGCELWDFSLVDPDNRRPVDYDVRSAMLATFAARDDRAALVDELLDGWTDGRIKLYVTWRLLQLRRAHRETFLGAAYTPLAVRGRRSDALVAFAREGIVVVAPRLIRNLARGPGLRVAFGDETVASGRPRARYRDVVDDREIVADAAGELAAADLLARAPVAVLVPE